MERTDDTDELLVLEDDTDELTERDTTILFDTIPEADPDTEADLVLLTDTEPVLVTEEVDVFEIIADLELLALDDREAVPLGLPVLAALLVVLKLEEPDPDSDLLIRPVTE